MLKAQQNRLLLCFYLFPIITVKIGCLRIERYQRLAPGNRFFIRKNGLLVKEFLVYEIESRLVRSGVIEIVEVLCRHLGLAKKENATPWSKFYGAMPEIDASAWSREISEMRTIDEEMWK